MGLLSGFTLGAFCVVLAILLVITVATEVILEEDIHPRTKFQGMLISTLISGLLASILIEKLNIHLLDN